MHKIEIEVNNTTNSPLPDDFLQEKNVVVSVALVSEEEMQKLNKQCRHKDSVTDILSFYEYESMEEIKNVADAEIFLGELILCYDDIVKYAKEEKIDFMEELANVFSHGILHLLGFKHGEEMFELQNKIKKQ